MFVKLYHITTDPDTTWKVFFSCPVVSLMIVSIFFHIVIYVMFFNLVSFIFLKRPLSEPVNTRLVVALVVIMTLGYVARFYHVKNIGAAFRDKQQARAYIDQRYNTWLFLG
jgi:hypothetical protein